MKLALTFLAAFVASEPINAPVELANANIRTSLQEIATGTRSDGNALLISQVLEFYLTVVHGLNANRVQMMLSYGCYCQLLTTRKIGIGEPVDEFDAICLKYQQCTRCVQHDEAGKMITNEDGKVECNWENGRYEISFIQGQQRVDCSANANKCGVNLCKECVIELGLDLAFLTKILIVKKNWPKL